MLSNSNAFNEPSPCLLLAESKLDFSFAIVSRLTTYGITPVMASTAHEAAIAMRDAVFMNNIFDGLLVDFQLPDANAYATVKIFREEFPGRPVAIMIDREDVCLNLWSAARGIALFRKPMVIEELSSWIAQLKRSMFTRSQCRLNNNLALS